jgi:hypothetical protein
MFADARTEGSLPWCTRADGHRERKFWNWQKNGKPGWTNANFGFSRNVAD